MGHTIPITVGPRREGDPPILVATSARARETLGWTPRYEDIEWSGLKFSKEEFEALQAFDHKAWRAEVHQLVEADQADHQGDGLRPSLL